MISLSEREIEKATKLLRNIPGGVEKAIVSTINKSIYGAKTDSTKRVTQEYVIKQARVREVIQVLKASKNSLSARIISRGRPRALTYFKTNPRDVPRKRLKKLLISQVKKGAGGPIKNAFLARMKSGHLGVFHRTGETRENSKLEIIKQNYGPSIAQMLGAKSVVAYVEEKAQKRIEKNLNHEIERILKGYGK